ncbi:unnamed protein product [Penicillium salamii]|uniref:Uncharacterized protein n=1 Tax=Penicillium salamii TaxID=1612424 RepID=A0A9W4N775_9EURO|nr:unnamed protein product [Penicillium salamii]CAG8033284.1 unnamed protein product [Penicillium salamii]CAG8086374.1 unnamed protein product [Penicillium salamii]CAG8168095.1 unnamed protein product [Penicillium salamii]CAG8202745.1 unnamed protein product [Penicillium salamii]
MHFINMPLTIIIGLILGLAQRIIGAALPIAETNKTDFIVTHKASDYFPHSKSDLSDFDIDVEFVGYPEATASWLISLDPHTGATDEDKARILTEVMYAKKYDEKDIDMSENVDSLLAHIAGHTDTKVPAKRPTFQTDSRNAVKWSECSPYFTCISGTSCNFFLKVRKAPRNRCESRGGQNCCLSWSNYHVHAGFFPFTFSVCDAKIRMQGITYASCVGMGDDEQGGDVCFSNRARHCT